LPGTLSGDGLPPFPGYAVIPGVFTPPPPDLPTSQPQTHSRVLLAAYRAAVGHHLGKKSNAYLRGLPKDPKDRERLTASASAMVEHLIPPVAWVYWRCAHWAFSPVSKKRPAPPLSFVFNAAKIAKLRGQFRAEMRPSTWGRLAMGPLHLDLLGQWRRAQTAVMRAAREGRNLEEACEAVLPADEYEEGVTVASEDAARRTQRIAAAVKRGAWVW